MQAQKTKQGYKMVKSLFGKYEEMPKDWKVSFVEELTEIDVSDGPHETPKFLKKGIPFFSVDTIQNNKIVLENLRYISFEDHLNYSKKCEPKKYDILLGKAASIGKVAYVDFDLEFNVWSPLAVIRIKKKFNPKFFFYFMTSHFFQKQIFLQANTNTQGNIGLKQIKKLKCIVPTPNEQHKITSILSNVDNLIKKYDSIIDSTQYLKTGLMQQLLTKGIRHTKFQKQKFCFSFLTEMFPTSWKNVKIKDIAHIVRGGSPRPAGDSKYFGGSIPWITVGELTKDDFMFLNSTENGLTDLGKKYSRFLDQGTVVISNSGYTLGHPKILNISGCANDGIAAFIELDEVIDPKFLYYSLKQWTKHLRNVNQGVFQVNLNTEILGNLYLPLPKIEEQHKIITILSDYDNYIKELESKFVFLSLLKKGLIQKLLTGQIRVKV